MTKFILIALIVFLAAIGAFYYYNRTGAEKYWRFEKLLETTYKNLHIGSSNEYEPGPGRIVARDIKTGLVVWDRAVGDREPDKIVSLRIENDVLIFENDRKQTFRIDPLTGKDIVN